MVLELNKFLQFPKNYWDVRDEVVLKITIILQSPQDCCGIEGLLNLHIFTVSSRL